MVQYCEKWQCGVDIDKIQWLLIRFSSTVSRSGDIDTDNVLSPFHTMYLYYLGLLLTLICYENNFLKMLFKLELFENTGFVFLCGWKTLRAFF